MLSSQRICLTYRSADRTCAMLSRFGLCFDNTASLGGCRREDFRSSHACDDVQVALRTSSESAGVVFHRLDPRADGQYVKSVRVYSCWDRAISASRNPCPFTGLRWEFGTERCCTAWDSISALAEGGIRWGQGDVLVPLALPVGYRVPLAEVLVPVPPCVYACSCHTYFLRFNFPSARRTEERWPW